MHIEGDVARACNNDKDFTVHDLFALGDVKVSMFTVLPICYLSSSSLLFPSLKGKRGGIDS